MDKSSFLQEIEILEITLEIFEQTKTLNFENLKIAQVSILAQALTKFEEIYPDHISQITDVSSFFHFLQNSGETRKKLKEIIDKQKKENGLGEEQIKEESSVPSTLEAMVAAYEQNQVERANLEDNNVNNISEAIKRARNTQLILQKARIRAERIKQPDEDKFFSKNIDPKTNNRTKIESNIRQSAEVLVTTLLAKQGVSQDTSKNQRVINEIVDQLESGSIKGYDELRYVSEIFIKDEYKSFKAEFDEVDNLVQQKQLLEITDPLNDQINDLERKITDSAEELSKKIDPDEYKKTKAELYSNDLDKFTRDAYSDAEYFNDKLKGVIPNPKLPFSNTDNQVEKFNKELAEYLKKNYPSEFHSFSDNQGARTVGIIQKTGNTNTINQSTVDLYSHGITAEKLDKLIQQDKLKYDDSNLQKLIKNHFSTSNLVRRQLHKFGETSIGKEIISRVENNPLNKFSPTVQKVLNPVGTAKDYIYKQFGQSVGNYLVKQTGNAASKKVGSFILKHGLKEGVNKFTSEAAKKLAVKTATWAATKLGISLAAESLNAIAPGLGFVVDVALQVVLWVVEKTYIAAKNKFNELYRSIYGEDFKSRDVFLTLGAGAATVGSVFALFKTGIVGFSTATKAAAISAVGIIMLSLATIAVFLTFTFMVAPLLSTFVQLDSVEKVKYEKLTEPTTPINCSNMKWPFEGTHPITQGPQQTTTSCTHGGSISESVDFSLETGTPILSISDGVVDSVGDDGDSGYGKYIKILAITDKGQKFIIIYGHLAEQLVSKNDNITAGQKIGISDNTGYSTGAHLHLGYLDDQGGPSPIEYNSCPAGGFKVNTNCCDTNTCNQP